MGLGHLEEIKTTKNKGRKMSDFFDRAQISKELMSRFDRRHAVKEFGKHDFFC